MFATHTPIFQSLDDAGVTWRIYQSDLAFAFLYTYVQAHTANVVPIAQFYTDAAAGTLPQVAFIDPCDLESLKISPPGLVGRSGRPRRFGKRRGRSRKVDRLYPPSGGDPPPTRTALS